MDEINNLTVPLPCWKKRYQIITNPLPPRVVVRTIILLPTPLGVAVKRKLSIKPKRPWPICKKPGPSWKPRRRVPVAETVPGPNAIRQGVPNGRPVHPYEPQRCRMLRRRPRPCDATRRWTVKPPFFRLRVRRVRVVVRFEVSIVLGWVHP